jgi:hypothetical protein
MCISKARCRVIEVHRDKLTWLSWGRQFRNRVSHHWRPWRKFSNRVNDLIPMNDTYIVPAGVSAIPRIAEHEEKASSLKFAWTYLQVGNAVLSWTGQVFPAGSFVVSSHTNDASTTIGRKRTKHNKRNSIEWVSNIVVGLWIWRR